MEKRPKKTGMKLSRREKKRQKRLFSLFYEITKNHKIVPVGNAREMTKKQTLKWARMFGMRRRIVKQDEISSGILVSTVFLGINHRHFGYGPPILFETMIFGGPRDNDMWRYTSYKKALRGHREALTLALERQDGLSNRDR